MQTALKRTGIVARIDKTQKVYSAQTEEELIELRQCRGRNSHDERVAVETAQIAHLAVGAVSALACESHDLRPRTR